MSMRGYVLPPPLLVSSPFTHFLFPDSYSVFPPPRCNVFSCVIPQAYIICIVVCVYLQEGRTAVYYASWKGHTAVLHLLLKEKADVNICKEVC